MDKEWLNVLAHLSVAAVAGGLIGLERSYHGRPAGFRTHTLVCVASSLLMLVTMYQRKWFAGAALETVRPFCFSMFVTRSLVVSSST